VDGGDPELFWEDIWDVLGQVPEQSENSCADIVRYRDVYSPLGPSRSSGSNSRCPTYISGMKETGVEGRVLPGAAPGVKGPSEWPVTSTANTKSRGACGWHPGVRQRPDRPGELDDPPRPASAFLPPM